MTAIDIGRFQIYESKTDKDVIVRIEDIERTPEMTEIEYSPVAFNDETFEYDAIHFVQHLEVNDFLKEYKLIF